MISVEKALRIIRDNATLIPKSEMVSLADSLNRVSAEHIFSTTDLPPFDVSLVDGYAVRTADIKLPPVELEVSGVIPAGTMPSLTLKPGKAIKIMTGAPMPDGADTVIMREDAKYEPISKTVRCFACPREGANISRKSEILRKGGKVLPQNSKITAQKMAVLAAIGKNKIRVYKRPSIAVGVTGSELADVSSKSGPGQIRNSNFYALQAQLNHIGLAVESLGTLKDDREILVKKVSEGLKSDILILTGGVAGGDYDYVRETLKSLGVLVLVDGVAMSPGRHFIFGQRRKCLVFALSGNPMSVFLCLELFVKEALAEICNDRSMKNEIVRAKLAEAAESNSKSRKYVPADSWMDDKGALIAQPVKTIGRGDIAALSRANSFVVFPPDSPALDAGSFITLMPIK